MTPVPEPPSPQTVEFFYDYGSPFSYLADGLLPALARRHGAPLRYRPLLLGAVFKATGNHSPMQESVEAKRRYGGTTLRRTAALVGRPFANNPHFPINTLRIMRAAIAAQRAGCFDAYHRVIYPAFWAEGRDMGDVEVVRSVLVGAGLDPQLLAAGEADGVKAELRANTEEAVSRGAFGAPTCFLGDAMFFGVDHLPFLERSLQEART